MDIARKMQRDWDRRAGEHARFFIATEDYQDESRFAASGEATARDLIEQLGGRDTREWTALEIGCGIGRVLRALAPRFRRLCGVDVSRAMIEQSRTWLAGVENVETWANTGVDLSAARAGTFDLVYSYVAFQHMPREVFSSYLAESRRVLRRDGWLLFQGYLGPRSDPDLGDTISLRIYEPEELRARLDDAGFAACTGLDPVNGPAVSRWVLARPEREPRPEHDAAWREQECEDRPAPLDSHLQRCLAEQLLEAGDLAGAREACARLIAYDPQELGAWLLLVSVHLELGDRSCALAELERLCTAHPDYTPAHPLLDRLRRIVRQSGS